MFYRRIFGATWLNWASLCLTVGWFIGSLIALLCSPDPVSFFWTETVNPFGGHYRYDFYRYYIGNAASNVATDILILTVPIPVVWRLQMRVLQKVMVSSVLLLGLLYVPRSARLQWTLANGLIPVCALRVSSVFTF